MDEFKLSQVIGNAIGGGVVAGALILVLWRVLSRVADRFIAALDKIAASVSEHTKVDLEHHAKVHEEVVRLGARVDGIVEERARRDEWDDDTPLTPVDSPRAIERERSRALRVVKPRGTYSLRKPTNGEEP